MAVDRRSIGGPLVVRDRARPTGLTARTEFIIDFIYIFWHHAGGSTRRTFSVLFSMARRLFWRIVPDVWRRP
jgi:hypothetical protein